MSKTALVTGGAGFIGSHLSARLRAMGWNVLILDDVSQGCVANLKYLGLAPDVLTLDVADPNALAALDGHHIDTVFHLAAQTSVAKSAEDPRADFAINVLGTLNVLESARRWKCRVVLASTVAVYSTAATMPITENQPTHASSMYGAAKAAAENYAFAYAASYGVPVVVLRIFNVYGPLMRKYVIHDIVRKLERDPRRLVLLGDGNQIRDYLYVEDAVAALVLAAERGAPGEVYNLGSGVPVRILDLASQIASQMGIQGLQIECTNESWPGDIARWYADVSKLAGLGFAAQVPWTTGLRKTIEFLTAHPRGL